MDKLNGAARPARGRRKSAAVCLLLAVMLCRVIDANAAVAWGSRGDQVILVQQKLSQYGDYKGAVDGVFGQSTYEAVVRFQRRNGLNADGVVGNATAAALGISLAKTSGGTSIGDGDVYLLARLVNGEARGEPYVGQVAVAAVVLNRVRSAYFPNTISGVVYQSGAFDCVADGQINLTPSADSMRAARDAMNGWDPTGGCIYYYNPSTATSSWIWSREVRLSIGAHAFAV